MHKTEKKGNSSGLTSSSDK
uniref:Uncharacterized protein n=1 Tax=Rhizophora mucronata TaxID=61149 RepID=A0A2P2R4V5_RHIMU